jgi:hypothetical protein
MADEETLEQKWMRLAVTIGEHYNADVIIYSGEVEDATADNLIRITKKKNRRKNVLLLLTTRGGSPDAAFRMARCLQSYYEKFIIYIYGMCKSAGTLIAVGADEIILSDFGEFGPLDVQLGKKDELFENISGLNITQALNSLNTRTLDFFRNTLIDLRQGSKGQISTKLAAEIASNLAIGAYEKIYSQVDPGQLGSMERAINIAIDYGKRLKSSNVKTDTIDRLVSSYPSHSFVIDIKEAKTLFKEVRKPDEVEEELGECISFVTRDQTDKPFVQKLNDPQEAKDERPDNDDESKQSAAGAQQGSDANNAPVAAKPEPTVRTAPRAVAT